MEEIRIGICDDAKEAIEEINNIVVRIMQEKKREWKAFLFTSGKELLESPASLHVLFLDIDMPDMDGIEVGHRMQHLNPNCKIIMATGLAERFKEVFSFGAFRFATKPFRYEEIEEALDAVFRSQIGAETVQLTYRRNMYDIPMRDIEYIRAINGYTEYRIEGKWFRKEITLDSALQFLDDRIFVRVNRQNIINLLYVNKYKNNACYIGETPFRVSRRIGKDFEQRLIECDLRYR